MDAKNEIQIVGSVGTTIEVSANLSKSASSTTPNWFAKNIFRMACAFKRNAPKDILGTVGIGPTHQKGVDATKTVNICM